VHFVGRLATYKYYNMDQVVAQALTVYSKLCNLPRAERPICIGNRPYRGSHFPQRNGSGNFSANGNGDALEKPSARTDPAPTHRAFRRVGHNRGSHANEEYRQPLHFNGNSPLESKS